MCANNDERKPHKERTQRGNKEVFFGFFFMCRAALGCRESTDVLTYTNAANFTAGRPRGDQRQQGQVTRSKVEPQKATAEAGVRALNSPSCTTSQLRSHDDTARKTLVNINTADRFLAVILS